MDKKNKSKLSFPVMFQKIEDVDTEDERFTRVKIWLMHLGQNFNGSIFEKEIIDVALPTLQYIPIVGFIEKNSLNEDDFSQHKYVMVRTVNGKKEKYIGKAYGVILSSEDNNAHYEERLCDDGETRTFLVVDGIIWNMFEDGSEIIQRDVIKPHSMELWDNGIDSYDGYEDEDGLFHFTKFSFRAACILGKDYEAGMINSTIEVQFTMCDFVKSMQSELNNKYTAFSKVVQKNKQGGKNMSKTNFSQTVMQLFDDISNIVRQHETYVDYWHDEVPRYCLCDIQDNEVIVTDRKNNYTHIGFAFTMDGDKPVVDFSSGKKKKIVYADYDEGVTINKNAFNFSKEISDIVQTAYTKIEAANKETEAANEKIIEAEQKVESVTTDFSNLKADFDEIKPKYDEYVKAEEEATAKAVTEQKNTLFKKFDAHLSEMDEYTEIKNNMDDMSVDEIETKCSILYTKKTLSATTDFSKTKRINNSGLSAGVPDIDNDDNDSELVQTKYGLIRHSN